MEEWRPVPGYEGRYEVSNEGRVRSFLFSRDGKLMKLAICNTGYFRVRLQFKKTASFVHRLVAQAFIPNPAQLPCVNHIDGNPLNNAVTNLEWITYSDNMRHSWRKLQSYKNRVAVCPRGEGNPNAKLNTDQVREIRSTYAQGGTTHLALAKQFGVSKPVVTQIIARRTWTHVA